jgi:uncharacterized repeat protein (TIGR01451 family)
MLSNTATIASPAGVTDTNIANNSATDIDTIATSTGGPGVTFVRTDTSTQGTWQGSYGGDGYDLAQGASSLPAYAQVAITGQGNFTWAASTTDVRALQKPGATDRLAACWYSSTSYTLDLTISGTQAHQVGLYLLDWDSFLGGRSERVDVLDANNPNTVLDTRTVNAFGGGEYLVWSISGHVLFRVTNLGGPSSNAVTSGLFFGTAGSAPQADLSITNSDGVTSVSPGGFLTYSIVVSNAGPSAVSGASVADTMPAALTGVSYTAVGSGGATGFSNGSGSISQAVNLPAGASITYTVSATVSSSATGSLSNTATVTAPSGVTDPNTANNSATDTDSISSTTSGPSVTFVKTDTSTQGTWQGAYGSDGYDIAQSAALLPSYAQVALTGQGNFTWMSSTTDVRALQKPGAGDRLAACWYSTTSYTLDVSLSGGQHQVALYLLDWDGFLGGRSERMDVLDAANPNTVLDTRTVTAFSSGEYLVWTISGHVLFRVTNLGGPSSNAVASGLFFGAAATGPQADLSITNTDGVTSVSPGGSVTYTIMVSNTGPSAATGATVADTMPAALSNVSYTAVGAGGATGFSGGTGSLNQTVNLPVGASITYTISATVSTSATGTLSNTATITTSAGVTDPNTANNSATDTDTITTSTSGPSVTFVKTDTTTQGTWQGAYGAGGYAIAQGTTALPSYATLGFTSQTGFTWAAPTTDVRALVKPGASDRLAACWYSTSSFTLDLTITGTQTHQVALYLLDWDNFLGGRTERIDVLDAGNPNTVLDTRTVSAFSGGEYLVWTISGHVLFRVTNLGGLSSNAVVSAVFFGTSSAPQLAVPGQRWSGQGLPPLTNHAVATVREAVFKTGVFPSAAATTAQAPGKPSAGSREWAIPDWWFMTLGRDRTRRHVLWGTEDGVAFPA